MFNPIDRLFEKNIILLSDRLKEYSVFTYLIKFDKKPICVIKLCLNNKHINILRKEVNNLSILKKLLIKSNLSDSLPVQEYFGTINGVTALVTRYKIGTIKEITLGQYQPPKKLIKRMSFFIDKCIEYLVKFQKNTGCAVHGDYDLCNIKMINGKIHIFDFENFQKKGSPLFDLSNLLFNPFIVNEDFRCLGDNLNGVLIEDLDVRSFWKEKLRYYSKLSGISLERLSLLPHTSVIEHRAMKFPYYRNPNTYPLYRPDVYDIFLNQRIDL